MSKSGSSLLRGAPRSEPSSPYVHAWYGHWIVPRACGSFTSTVPRWRHTLRKARSSPSRSSTTTTGRPPTCVGNMLPGPLSSPVCPAYCQERRKIRSRSAAATAGSAYQLYGSVSTRDSTCVRPIGGLSFQSRYAKATFAG